MFYILVIWTTGEDIEYNIRDNLKDYQLEDSVDFRRVGVTMDQIGRFHLPQDPDAETLKKLKNDPRGKAFMERHEGELFQVEVDALLDFAPDEFKRVLLEPIDEWFREDIHNEVMSREEYSEKVLNDLRNREVTKLYNEISKK